MSRFRPVWRLVAVDAVGLQSCRVLAVSLPAFFGPPAVAQDVPCPVERPVASLPGVVLSETSRAYEACLEDLRKEKSTAFAAAKAACRNPEWNLDQMRIREAWQFLAAPSPARGWAGSRRPGAGIVVGQVDTGYTLHPSIKCRLDLVSAMNVLEPKNSALDTFSKGFLGVATLGFFPNPLNRDPGHGTKTASLLVGDPSVVGNPAETGWATGAAPWVRFIPVRGSKGPALGLVGQVQAARAICYLAGGRPRPRDEDAGPFCTEPDPDARETIPIPPLPPRANGRRAVDVISISRAAPIVAGVDVRQALKDAIRFARERGVIIVAASGDHESLTAYPAEDCAAISVGGTVITGAPWLASKPLYGSPHASPPAQGASLDSCDRTTGLKIDVSAPSAGVWRATTKRRQGRYDPGRAPFEYGIGKGTSFGTPSVAGIAAMWLQYNPALRERYRVELIPYVFSYVLRRTARDPVDACLAMKPLWVEWPEKTEIEKRLFCEEQAAWWTRAKWRDAGEPAAGKPSLYGAGIADALGVLERELPDPTEVCADLQRRGADLPRLGVCR